MEQLNKNKNIFNNLLKNKNILILDGGLGSELHRAYQNNKEMEKNLQSQLWSAKILEKDPNQIEKIHQNYIDSGADIILSSSYQANLSVFMENGYSQEQSISLMQKSVEIICNILLENKNILCGISLGPYGAKDGQEYSGEYGESVDKLKLMEFHRNRIEILLNSKCFKENLGNICQRSFLCFETIPNLLEIQAICELLQQKDFKLPVAVSLQCRDAFKLADNTDLIQKILPLICDNENIQCIGVNCCDPLIVEQLLDNIQKFLKEKQSNVNVMCYPNNGKKWDHDNMQYIEGTELNAQEYAKLSQKWKQNGAQIIGGCCCTTPEYIQELKKQYQ